MFEAVHEPSERFAPSKTLGLQLESACNVSLGACPSEASASAGSWPPKCYSNPRTWKEKSTRSRRSSECNWCTNMHQDAPWFVEFWTYMLSQWKEHHGVPSELRRSDWRLGKDESFSENSPNLKREAVQSWGLKQKVLGSTSINHPHPITIPFAINSWRLTFKYGLIYHSGSPINRTHTNNSA